MFTVGFELEFAGLGTIRTEEVLRGIVPTIFAQHHHGLNNCWAISREGTVQPRGTEIKSPRNPDRCDIELVLLALREAGAYVTRRAALHIHISSPDDSPIDVNLPYIKAWPQRRNYAFNIAPVSRKSIHRITNSHIEVRVFNASLKTRYVLKMLDLVQRSTTYCTTFPRSSYKAKVIPC